MGIISRTNRNYLRNKIKNRWIKFMAYYFLKLMTQLIYRHKIIGQETALISIFIEIYLIKLFFFRNKKMTLQAKIRILINIFINNMLIANGLSVYFKFV